MPQEYYDRDQSEERLLSPSNQQQETYWMLRSSLTAAISKNIQEIREEFPEIDQACFDLDRYVRLHPRRAFKIFKPEDCRSEHTADAIRTFLR